MFHNSIKQIKIEDGFIGSAAGILAFTGFAKLWVGVSDTKILNSADPLLGIFGISIGQMVFAAGIIELIVAALCFFCKSRKWALRSIAWLTTNFVLYRIGLWWVGWKRPCPCLGNLTDSLHISPKIADSIMIFILTYLFLGGYGLLIRQNDDSRM